MGKKPFHELEFSDSFMFAATMEDADICREVLELAIGIPIRQVNIRSEAMLLTNGMEVQYMLFSEMLDDERKEAQDNLLYLMSSMEANGESDKIPLLWKNTDFLQEMYQKYHIEA